MAHCFSLQNCPDEKSGGRDAAHEPRGRRGALHQLLAHESAGGEGEKRYSLRTYETAVRRPRIADEGRQRGVSQIYKNLLLRRLLIWKV